MGEENQNLAEQFIAFSFNLARWSAFYSKAFNVNGRNGGTLTARQFGMLLVVDKMGSATVTEFEALLNLSKSSLSLTLSKLVREGYLTKESPEDAEDRRKVFFHITERGKRELDALNGRMIQLFDTFYSSLTDVQKQDLKIGIEKLSSIFGGGFGDE